MAGRLKQIACGRRKPGTTRKEYLDHHYQVHGAISDAPTCKAEKPTKYIQTHVFDAVFPPRKNGPMNANQNWYGRDDVSELYFEDLKHLLTTFGSEHVKTVARADAPLFADFETTMAMLAREKEVPLRTPLAESSACDENLDDNTVAMYFLSAPDNERNVESLEAPWTSFLGQLLIEHCPQDAARLIVNTGTLCDGFDLNAYFGGADMPQFAVVYKIVVRSPSSMSAIRKAQKAFEVHFADQIDTSECFMVFGREALVLDVERDIKFDPSRQPVFHDLG